MSEEEATDRILYPIKAVIAYRKAKWWGHRSSRLRDWCEMAAVPASVGGPLAEPYKRWHPSHGPLPIDPLLKLSVLVVKIRAAEEIDSTWAAYWYDALQSAEAAEQRGVIEIPLVSETVVAWKARKSAEMDREIIL